MKNFKYKEYFANVAPCIIYGVMCGILTGAVIFLFKFLAKKAEDWSRWLYGAAATNWIYVVLVFLVLIGAALFMIFIHKKIPEAKGGGIPRSEGVLRGILTFRWFRTLIGGFFGSMLSFICGLPLGNEGPSVLIGTSIGGMSGVLSKKQTAWRRYVMTGGAGAGFAVATGAPLSGILFALEEIHKRFTPMLVLTVSISVISASYVNELLCAVFNLSPKLIEVGAIAILELKHVGYLFLFGVLVAVAVALFDLASSSFAKLTKRLKKQWTASIQIFTIFILTGVFCFIFTDGAYSGRTVISDLISNDLALYLLVVILLVRTFMMLLVTNSGATGGIFIPALAIGALVGALSAKLFVAMGLPTEYTTLIIVLGMCAFIGGILRAPLTATVFFIELTGQFTNLLFVAIVIFVSNFITEILNQKPMYDRALEAMEEEQNDGKQASVSHFRMTVLSGSFVVGKAVRDIMWPSSSVVVGITRANELADDTDNNGEKKLYIGDTIVLRARYYDEQELITLLKGLVGSVQTIEKVKFGKNE